MTMRFTIEGQPASKKNSLRAFQVRGRQVVMQSKQSTAWEKTAIEQLLAGKFKYRNDPNCHRAEQRWNLRALFYRTHEAPGDLGNFLASACDALERAGVVENDRYIAGFDGSRMLVDKARPRVEIELTEMEVGI